MITDPKLAQETHHKYLSILSMVWITVLITGLFTAAKTFDIGPFNFSVSVIFYPVTYIFTDLFTEVYGYKKTRKIVWTGLACMVIATTMSYIYCTVPPSATYQDNTAFSLIFKASPIFAVVGVVSFFIGEFANSYILAKMKVATKGKYFWLRLVMSTAVGQTLDNGLCYVGAFLLAGYFTLEQLPNLIFSTVAFCTVWEFLATPVTYKIASFLKKAEGLDIYDHDTNFNPFSLSDY